MASYVAKIEHTPETIKKMFWVERSTYHLFNIILQQIIGALLLMSAFLGNLHIGVQGLFLLFGSWLIVSKDFWVNLKVQEVLEVRQNNLPIMHYKFDRKGILISGEGETKLSYSKIERLVYEENYLFLFFGKNEVCMIDRASVSSSEEEFIEFMEQQTKCEWKRVKSVFTLNFFDMLTVLKDRFQSQIGGTK